MQEIRRTGFEMKDEPKSDAHGALTHRQAAELLPWFVMGKLDLQDAERFAAHLDNCAVCEAEVKAECELRELYGSVSLHGPVPWTGVRPTMMPAFDSRPRHGLRNRLRQGMAYVRRKDRRVMALVSGQAAVICLLLVSAPGVQPPLPSDDATYRGLSGAPVVARGNALVMFDPEATERQIRAALASVRATIVDGPGEGGAYLIQLAPADRDQSLRLLRSQSAIALAEAVDAGDMP